MLNLRSRKSPDSQDETSTAADTGPETVETGSLSDADQIRAAAATARSEAEQLRAEAQTLMQAARAEAARIIAAAEQQARAAETRARAADQRGIALEEHARVIDHAQAVREQAEAAEQHAADLDAEAQALTEETSRLDEQLRDLAQQREHLAADLTTARDTGDVTAVTDLRGRLASIDEVTAALTGQRDTARRRANDIGEQGWGGELDNALAQADRYRQQHSDLLDKLDPARIDQRRNQIMANFTTMARTTMPDETALPIAALATILATDPDLVTAAYGSETATEVRR